MAKDSRMESMIKSSQALLAGKYVDTKLWIVNTVPASPKYFRDKLAISEEYSELIYSILITNNIIDYNGIPLRNPKATKWFDILLEEFPDPKFIHERHPHLLELLNLAYGFHENTSSYIKEILQWCIN